MIYIAAYWILVPICLGVRAFRREKYLALTWVLLLINLVINTTNSLLTHYERSAYPLYHVYTLVEFILLGWLYCELLRHPPIRKVIRGAVVLFSVYKILDMVWITPINRVDYVAINLEAILLIVLALLFYVQQLRDGITHRIAIHPAFWINNAILFYFTGIVLFSFSFFHDQENDILWAPPHLNYYQLLLRDLLFAVAFWFANRLRQSTSMDALVKSAHH